MFGYAGDDDAVEAANLDGFEDAVRAGRSVVTEDAFLLCRSEQIDAIMDVTGSVEFGAQVALEAFEHGKHFVAMNAELDAPSGRSSTPMRASTESSSPPATETSRGCR